MTLGSLLTMSLQPMLNLIKSSTMQKFWLAILGLLGFTACGVFSCEYGTPTTDFNVKGKVTDSEGTPIKGIVVSSTGLHSFVDGTGLSAMTDEKGEFVTNKIKEFGVMGTLVFTDVDGAENGGDFETYEKDLSKFPQTQVKEGEGWYRGEYEVTAEVKLTKK